MQKCTFRNVVAEKGRSFEFWPPLDMVILFTYGKIDLKAYVCNYYNFTNKTETKVMYWFFITKGIYHFHSRIFFALVAIKEMKYVSLHYLLSGTVIRFSEDIIIGTTYNIFIKKIFHSSRWWEGNEFTSNRLRKQPNSRKFGSKCVVWSK